MIGSIMFQDRKSDAIDLATVDHVATLRYLIGASFLSTHDFTQTKIDFDL